MRSTAAAVAVLGLLLGGCREQPKPVAENSALPPVSLPDLSSMSPPVQQQLTAQYQSLNALIESRGAPADLARAYGDMGRLLMAAEYFDAAEPFYLHAQRLQPDEVRWPYYLGHVYLAKADPTKATASFERVLMLAPGDLATLVWLGKVHLDQGRPDAAEALFAQALSRQPRMVAALYGLGQAALARREYSRAVEQFEQVLSTDPRASIAHYPLALAYRALGDTAKAEAHLRQQGGVEVGPPDPLMVEMRGLLRGAVAEENRGVRALEAGDFAEAARRFREAVTLAPNDASLRHKFGTALSLTGDTAAAVAQFQEAIRLSPGFAQAHYSLGVLFAGNGRDREAVERFLTAVKFDPDYIDARLQLAATLGRMGQLDRALAQYQQVVAIDPRSADGQFGIGMAFAGLRRYREAREAFAAGAKTFPDQSRFSEALSRIR